MKIPAGALAQGVTGTTLLGSWITGGTLYYQEKTAHDNLINDIKQVQNKELTVEKYLYPLTFKDSSNTSQEVKLLKFQSKIKCPSPTNPSSTEYEKILSCERFWIEQTKQSFIIKNQQLELTGEEIGKIQKCWDNTKGETCSQLKDKIKKRYSLNDK